MKKVKYYYSSKNHRFEPIRVPVWKKLLRLFGLMSAVVVTAAIIVALAFQYIQSPNEKRMNKQLSQLQEKYDRLSQDIMESRERMTALEDRDNQVYRVIFEAKPLSKEIRTGRINPDDLTLAKKLSPFSNDALMASLDKNMHSLKRRMDFQEKSYDTLQKFIEKKQEMLASIPSIQPVSNKQLERIASGFGYRIDPIYKIGKFHAGLDFTAPTGTPIYATGDGVVESADYHESGFGNHIWIRHGFGYRTHYCHMVKMKARPGQTVKRGMVIGWVGSTGKSTGPHCHYEVEKSGEKIDPIHFFYNDLKPEDFDRMVQMAQAGNQAFD